MKLKKACSADGSVVECTVSDSPALHDFFGDFLWSAAFSGLLSLIHRDPIIFAAITTTSALLLASFHVIEEKVLVVRGAGVQTSVVRGLRFTSGHTVRLNASTSMLPRDAILDVFVNEAILRWKIVDYIAIATHAPTSLSEHGPVPYGRTLHVIFPHLLPRLNMVEAVYRTLHSVIFDDAFKGD